MLGIMAAIYEIYDKIIKYIDEHVKKDITLDDISKFLSAHI